MEQDPGLVAHHANTSVVKFQCTSDVSARARDWSSLVTAGDEDNSGVKSLGADVVGVFRRDITGQPHRMLQGCICSSGSLLPWSGR